jgi:hypothetical protein
MYAIFSNQRGKTIEVLREKGDGRSRTMLIGVNGGGGNRQNARAFAAAKNAVVVLSATQTGKTLIVDNGVKPFGCEVAIALGERTYLLQDRGCFFRVAFPIEQTDLRQQ